MQITINGEPAQITEANLTLARLLKINRVEAPDMVSVRLNEEIIDRTRYETTRVTDNDEIEFLYFMGGGAGRCFAWLSGLRTMKIF